MRSKRLIVELNTGVDFQHDLELIELREDGRHLSLAEGVSTPAAHAAFRRMSASLIGR
jgi:hypothetical protein